MSVRSPFSRYSLIAATATVLAGLIYLQFMKHLPHNLQISNTNAKSLRAEHPGCALADVPDDHMLVAAVVWEGAIPTDLVIGGSTQIAKIVRVSITPGEKPLTVFLSGFNVIWDFSGAVERVQRVVASSPILDRRLAVAGVAAERIEFPVLSDCKLATAAPLLEDEATRVRALSAMFGRRPDRTGFERSAVHVSLPDATFGMRADQIRANGPATALEPDRLVSALAITRPAVLPGEAGLKQLEAAGVIRRPTNQELDAFIEGASAPYQSKLSPDFRLDAKFDYVVTRKTSLPRVPGLRDWRFLVLAGVPTPQTVGRMCIAQMDGFRVNNVDACYKGAREGIHRLRQFPAADRLSDCRLLEPPEQISLEAVAVYEPEGPELSRDEVLRRLNGKKATHHPIDVTVEKPGDVMLVLNTYNPAIWRVSAGPETRIAGVLMIGYYASSVEGLAPETPVLKAEHEGRETRSQSSPACTRLLSSFSGAYRGGPDALVFDRQVFALTGRNLDGLRGSYRLRTVHVR